MGIKRKLLQFCIQLGARYFQEMHDMATRGQPDGAKAKVRNDENVLLDKPRTRNSTHAIFSCLLYFDPINMIQLWKVQISRQQIMKIKKNWKCKQTAARHLVARYKNFYKISKIQFILVNYNPEFHACRFNRFEMGAFNVGASKRPKIGQNPVFWPYLGNGTA